MSGTAITRGQAIYALIIIFLANFINYVDRFLVSAVLSGISNDPDFKLTKGEAGATWTAFTVGYMLTAPLIGYLSDRKRRATIFGVCILLWSLATVGTGLAHNYFTLMIMRLLTGVGEGGCLIIGPTMIADYFAPSIRGKMLAIFYLGMPLGGTIGFLMGGLFESWRTAFFVAGAPGIGIALLVVLLKEPVRGGSEGAGAAPSHSIDFSNIGSYFQLFRTRTLLYITLAQAAAVFTFIPLVHFGETYLKEIRHLSKEDAMTTLGVLLLFGGLMGNFLGGTLGDRWVKKNRAAYSLIAGICILIGFPLLLTAVLSFNQAVYSVCLFACVMLFFACMPAFNTQIANVTDPHQRAMAYALVVFVVHILGDTVSPIIFGLCSDKFGMQPTFGIFTVFLLLSSLFCFLASRHATGDFDKVHSST